MKKVLRTIQRRLTRPDFSVIVPLDGSEDPETVERTLRSALNQSLRSIEAVVTFTDALPEAIERLEALRLRDARIRLLDLRSENEAPPASLVAEAVRSARGRFMLLLHCPERLAEGILEAAREQGGRVRADLLLMTPMEDGARSRGRGDDPDPLVYSDLRAMAWAKQLWERRADAPPGPYWAQETALSLVVAADRIGIVDRRMTRAPGARTPVPPYRVGTSAEAVRGLSESLLRRSRLVSGAPVESRRAAGRRWLAEDLAPWTARIRECPLETEEAVRDLVRAASKEFTEADWLGLPFWDRILAWTIAEGAPEDVDEIIIARRWDSDAVPLKRGSEGRFSIDAGILRRIASPPLAATASKADLRLEARVWDVRAGDDGFHITMSVFVPGVDPAELPEPDFRAVVDGRPLEVADWERVRVEGIDLHAHDPWRTYVDSGFSTVFKGVLPERVRISLRLNGAELSREITIPPLSFPHEGPVVDSFSVHGDSAVFGGTGGAERPFDLWLESSSDSRRVTVETSATGWGARVDLATAPARGGYFLRWGARGVDSPSGWCSAGGGFAVHPLRMVGRSLGVELARRGGGRLGVVLSPPVPSEIWSRYGQQRAAGDAPPSVRRGVFFDSFGGKNTGDSPGALCRALIAGGCDAPMWFAVIDPRTIVPEGAVPVVVGTAQWYEAMRSARVIVSNNHLPPWFSKQAGQYWVQTWHGTPIKRLLRDAPREFIPVTYRRLMDGQVPQWDLLLAQSEQAAEDMRSSTGYGGEVRVGEYPRNMRLVQGDAESIRRGLGIAPEEFVVLHAPTWRDSDQQSEARSPALLDPLVLAEEAGIRVLARSHHMSADGPAGGGVIDVSAHPHVEDLMLAADLLVTDYSSIVFDFALTGRPVILHVPDLEWYRDVERGFYRDWPADSSLPVTRTPADLIAEVRRMRDAGRAPSSVDSRPIMENLAWLVERIDGILNA